MPEYRYRCNDCELIFDVERAMKGNHIGAPCPKCGQPCDRVWTTPVIVFRGADFSLALQAEETEPAGADELCDGIEGLESVGTFKG